MSCGSSAQPQGPQNSAFFNFPFSISFSLRWEKQKGTCPCLWPPGCFPSGGTGLAGAFASSGRSSDASSDFGSEAAKMAGIKYRHGAALIRALPQGGEIKNSCLLLSARAAPRASCSGHWLGWGHHGPGSVSPRVTPSIPAGQGAHHPSVPSAGRISFGEPLPGDAERCELPAPLGGSRRPPAVVCGLDHSPRHCLQRGYRAQASSWGGLGTGRGWEKPTAAKTRSMRLELAPHSLTPKPKPNGGAQNPIGASKTQWGAPNPMGVSKTQRGAQTQWRRPKPNRDVQK